jgi:hypothetical protein
MRAADEPSTEVWSCGNCPIDESRVRFSEPTVQKHTSYPRVLHRKSASDVTYAGTSKSTLCSYAELSLSCVPSHYINSEPVNNTRYPCAVNDSNGVRVPAHVYDAGVYAGMVVHIKHSTTMSPKCRIIEVRAHNNSDTRALSTPERDGVVRTSDGKGQHDIYVYSRSVSTELVHTAVVRLDNFDADTKHSALVALHSIQEVWPDIRGFVSKDYLSTVNNLSPRAWDSKRIQKRGAIYSPKVDGERAYVVVYKGVAHVFSKGKGYAHIGWRILEKEHDSHKPVVVDVENTLSYGCFFIDMLTDRKGNMSPKTRDYGWSLKEILWLRQKLNIEFITFKPYYNTLKEAEASCSSFLCPTDGVVALWEGDTTARKMKQERSIELLLRENGDLVSSDGDVVIEAAPVPIGIEPGSIVEVRFKLNKDGSSIMSRQLFKRTDKVGANSSSAVSSVLESFSCVSRSDETRRRNVTMWCDSLRSSLVKEAVNKCGDRKVIMDVGSGTGQSLDSLTNDRGVSYILIEPDEAKCEQLKRRAGVGKVSTEPRDILSNIRGLKSGSQTYMVLCCTLSQIVSDEDLMSSIHTEIGAALATFSAHFVVSDLYDLSTYWSIPVVGCFYPYDNIVTSQYLVNTLGVRMKKDTETSCSVVWGGDKKYEEPCTVTSEYQVFSSVYKATEMLQAPGQQLDEDVFNICNKIYVIL